MVSQDIVAKYRPTIGIECHVQLKTKSKLFSGADNDARNAQPNTAVSPICFGLPGTLPVLNKEAVDLTIKAGIALNAHIADVSGFDRKHYFYPDLPKGYQITQLERPIVGNGVVEVPLKEGVFKVRIIRAHLEEDAGKLAHPENGTYSLVDLNRAGTPLLEIVSEADMHSPEEAKAYVQELYLLMKYAQVSDCDLYYGNMRFDVNVSVAPIDATEKGTRTETKNLNSFKSVERAVEYEYHRQAEVLEKGGHVLQETRGWNEAAQKTTSQRSKEEAQDYRYFPEPDVPPFDIPSDKVERMKQELEPHLPPALRRKLAGVGVRADLIETLLLADAEMGTDYINLVLETTALSGKDAALGAVNYLINRDLKARKDMKELTALPNAEHFALVSQMVQARELSSNAADALLQALARQPEKDGRTLAAQLNLVQENDQAKLEAIIDEVLATPASQQAISDIKAGQQKAVGYLVGQVMKQSRGAANPSMVSEIILRRLS